MFPRGKCPKCGHGEYMHTADYEKSPGSRWAEEVKGTYRCRKKVARPDGSGSSECGCRH